METPRPTHDTSSLEQRLAVLEAREAARQRGRRRWLAALVVVASVGATLSLAAPSGACPNGYLYCFAPDTPARADQVNYDFSQIKDWVETKVGLVGTSGVQAASLTTTGTLTSTGLVTANNGITVNTGAATFNSAVALNQTLTVGSGANAKIVGMAMGWCDCEMGSNRVDITTGTAQANVPEYYLFEQGAAGTFQCRAGRFLVGIEQSNGGCTGSITCLEQFKCCRPCLFQVQGTQASSP